MCCRKSEEVGYTFHCNQAIKYAQQRLKGEIVLGDIVHNVSGKHGSRNVRLLITLGPQSGNHVCATEVNRKQGHSTNLKVYHTDPLPISRLHFL